MGHQGHHGYHSLTCLFPPQRSVVQATPQAPKAGPVQQLTVQGLQPVHVAQEVRVSSTYLRASWDWARAGLGRGAGPSGRREGMELGVLKGPSPAPGSTWGFGLQTRSWSRPPHPHPSPRHLAVQGPRFCEERDLIFPSQRHRVGDLSGCCGSSATRWAAEAWSPARGRPR